MYIFYFWDFLRIHFLHIFSLFYIRYHLFVFFESSYDFWNLKLSILKHHHYYQHGDVLPSRFFAWFMLLNLRRYLKYLHHFLHWTPYIWFYVLRQIFYQFMLKFFFFVAHSHFQYFSLDQSCLPLISFSHHLMLCCSLDSSISLYYKTITNTFKRLFWINAIN